MPRLLIGNWGNEAEAAGIPAAGLPHAASQGQRMLWGARPGDALILAAEPDPGFLAYAAALIGLAPGELEIVVAPGADGGGVLTRDRFTGEEFLGRLGRLVCGRGIDRAEPFYLDGYVSRLARRLGLDKGTPAFGFMSQGGNELLNSKVTFRAVAAGTGVPVPEGIVTDAIGEAVDFLWEMLGSQRAAIAKQDSGSGGFGNEVLSAAPGLAAIGAAYHRVCPDRDALARHVARRWPWYTGDNRRRAVFEEYAAGATPIWGEIAITDESVTVYGHGEVRMNPTCAGVIIPVPPPYFGTEPFLAFLAYLETLGATMRAMGYRGLSNIDAILTQDGRVLFNEFNGRYGGSTHLFTIGMRVIGGDYLADRCLIEQRDCAFPAFAAAQRELSRSGLAYDPATRTGVIIAVYGTEADGSGGEACIVGTSLGDAERIERELLMLFRG
ncbi:MAG TPA: peptide ligase PGM1-related protein [Trebonia sp.]|jgi:hypothetical protein|nr:peptide ligase PGM1-related protein [Trebonia sp.]